MKYHKKIFGTLFAVLLLCITLTTSAFAVESPVFQDVTADSPWYDGVTYAAENGITSGTGNGIFSPNQNITVRQWAVMICRAYGKQVTPDANNTFGTAELKLAHEEGWLDVGAMVAPDSPMCRRYLYESIFRVERIPVFSTNLYVDGELSHVNRFVQVAKENGFCEQTDDEFDLISRGEAVQLIYLMQTQELEMATPTLIQMVNLVNTDQVSSLNSFLQEIRKIPDNILYEFQANGWSYRIDSDYVESFSDRIGMECAGCCSYLNKSIYVKQDYATIHEFGHFYHRFACKDSSFNDIYMKEHESARSVLGDYAATNKNEYFAEAFDYWINWSDNSAKMDAFASVAPETHAFFSNLAANNWC